MLLWRMNRPLNPTVLVKLAFLLRQEKGLEKNQTFYDFVPYKYGPFSFSLYKELANLKRDGYLDPIKENIVLNEQTRNLTLEKIKELPSTLYDDVDSIINQYGNISQSELVKDVYNRYPWYASKSELPGLKFKSSISTQKALKAVYTAGYEGKSVDAFFNQLLVKGPRLIIDVRANPVSRSYGFSKRQLAEIGKRLGLGYQHMPHLGIPSEYRSDLTDYDSYQRLLNTYEDELLPQFENEIIEVGELMERTAAVLVCVEKDVQCCHRSRLAVAISRKTGLEVKHL